MEFSSFKFANLAVWRHNCFEASLVCYLLQHEVSHLIKFNIPTNLFLFKFRKKTWWSYQQSRWFWKKDIHHIVIMTRLCISFATMIMAWWLFGSDHDFPAWEHIHLQIWDILTQLPKNSKFRHFMEKYLAKICWKTANLKQITGQMNRYSTIDWASWSSLEKMRNSAT